MIRHFQEILKLVENNLLPFHDRNSEEKKIEYEIFLIFLEYFIRSSDISDQNFLEKFKKFELLFGDDWSVVVQHIEELLQTYHENEKKKLPEYLDILEEYLFQLIDIMIGLYYPRTDKKELIKSIYTGIASPTFFQEKYGVNSYHYILLGLYYWISQVRNCCDHWIDFRKNYIHLIDFFKNTLTCSHEESAVLYAAVVQLFLLYLERTKQTSREVLATRCFFEYVNTLAVYDLKISEAIDMHCLLKHAIHRELCIGLKNFLIEFSDKKGINISKIRSYMNLSSREDIYSSEELMNYPYDSRELLRYGMKQYALPGCSLRQRESAILIYANPSVALPHHEIEQHDITHHFEWKSLDETICRVVIENSRSSQNCLKFSFEQGSSLSNNTLKKR